MQATKRISKRFSAYMSHSLLKLTTATDTTPILVPTETDMSRSTSASSTEADEELLLFGEPPTDGRPRIDQIPDHELVVLFDVTGPGSTADGGYVSARNLGVPVVQIAGMAPSLQLYHALWRHRYTLEVQLPHNWGPLLERYRWPGLPSRAVRTGDTTRDIKVARELCVLLRLSARVLESVGESGDVVNTVGWVREELAAVAEDEERWRAWLKGMLAQEGGGGGSSERW